MKESYSAALQTIVGVRSNVKTVWLKVFEMVLRDAWCGILESSGTPQTIFGSRPHL
ncbi:MAG: hypothetical protein H6686_02845 [Fibrobacteria bacterium]|nr:hypothetical protein [Fibrobacteria bacterium]